MKLTITKEFQWDCAHRLFSCNMNEEENQNIFGKCYNLHGHTYKLFVTISQLDNKLINGMVMNFNEMKKIVGEVIERFDHKYLNNDELYKNGERETTCENQIQDIWNMLDYRFVEKGAFLEELKLYETPTSFATLRR